MDITQLLGRLHPLILHLPIGILAIAFLMAWMGRKPKYQNLHPAIGLSLLVGMCSAIFAAGSGYFLSLEGGYNEDMLWQHKWLGIATAVVSVIVYVLFRREEAKASSGLFFPVFGVLMLLLSVTGHIGGSLTHGSDFLTEPFNPDDQSEAVVIANMDSAQIFADLIRPIFKEKCVGCHNESKIKGDLLMTTIEGIQKGGETGPMFVAGDINNSLFLERAHLPLEEKEHMPPKGKKQLSEDELALLEWWVAQQAPFDKIVAEVERPEPIPAILTKYAQSDNSVYALDVEVPKAETLADLQGDGIPVVLITEGQPFVSVTLSGRQDISRRTFKQLRSVSEQLIELDLSKTNMNDKLLAYLSEFPHLTRLSLNQTQVTGRQLEDLSDLKYLSYLNLYNTPVEDQAIASLSRFASLENLYLWRTNVSPSAIETLRKAKPRLLVNTGVDQEIFGDAALKAPIIHVEKDIFVDSVEVSFEINFRGVDLLYTLDGTTPDSTSSKYTDPLILTETSEIKVIAFKEGWETSPPASRTVVKAAFRAQNIQLSSPPNDRYKGEGGLTLTDFVKGSISFTDGKWLGYEGRDFTATLDLGEVAEVSNVAVSALEATGSYIFFPKAIEVQLSTDGKVFQDAVQRIIPITKGPEPPLMNSFPLGFDPKQARYVRVKIKSHLKNPAWHPAPGAPCWIFIDEIMVE
jgi:uncharacterized membrane protein